jgi:hypothetical protein
MAYRSAAASTFSSGTSLVATLPTMVTGDYVGAFYAQDVSGLTITPPTGWTLRATGDGGADGQTFRYYDLNGGYSGSAPSSTWITDAGFGRAIIQIVSLSGRTIGRTFATTSSGAGGGSPISISATGGTAAAGDDLIACVNIDQSDATPGWAFGSWGGGFTERLESVANEYSSLGLATLDGHAGGATGSVAVTATAASGFASWLAMVVAIPSGGAPPAGSLPPIGGSRDLLTGRLPHLRMDEREAAEVVRASMRAAASGRAFSFLSAR